MKRWLLLIGLLGFLTSFTMLERDNAVGFSVYPHPIIKKTKVSADVELIKVEVYNLLGNKVLERESQGELDFADLPSGYYIIKAYSEKGELIKRVQKY